MTRTSVAVDTITPIQRDEVTGLALDTYERLLGLLRDLSPSQWRAATPCTGWAVDDIVGHLIGAAEGNARLRETLRQQLHGLRDRHRFGGSPLDAVNDLQVREHAGLEPARKIETLAAVYPDAIAGRMRLPALLRRIDVPNDPAGSMPEGAPTSINLGWLMDVVYTRDVWLHRLDIAIATDEDPRLGGAADARIVEDVVRDWATRHGQPFHLELTGAAGGAWHRGSGGPTLSLPVRDFAFAVSHREPAEGLLRTFVVF